MTNIVLGYVNHQLERHKKKLFLSFFCITVVCHNSWLIYSQGEKRNRTTGTVSVSLITSVLQWELCEVRSRKGPNQSTKKSWWVTDDAGSLRLSGAEGATAADWGQAAVWEVWKVGLFCFLNLSSDPAQVQPITEAAVIYLLITTTSIYWCCCF